MVTPELISYVRGEINKGRTREEIHTALLKEGGWTELDINEAFRIVIPMQGFGQSSIQNIGVSKVATGPSSRRYIGDIIFIIISLVCISGWYFYRAPVTDFWNSSTQSLSSSWNRLSEFSGSFFAPKISTETDVAFTQPEEVPEQSTPVVTARVAVLKDCGTSNAPDLKKSSVYENDATFKCLGDVARECIDNAKAVLKDPLFPTLFEIVHESGTCNFKLSYSADTTLVDQTGKKLAWQYISCPVSIVKAVQENAQNVSFSAPSTDNSGKYASQIYFYGTLGIFMEQNLDQNKIKALGCSGGYIDSVIASY